MGALLGQIRIRRKPLHCSSYCGYNISTMTNPSLLPAKERAIRSRLLQLCRGSGLIRATWVKHSRPCGSAICKCAQSKRYWHKSWSISQSHKGKLRRKSIPSRLRDEVGEWLKQYWETRELLDQVSEEYWNRLDKKTQRK